MGAVAVAQRRRGAARVQEAVQEQQVAASSPLAAPAAKFEAARAATEQRDAKSIGSLDKPLLLQEVVISGSGSAAVTREKDRVHAMKRAGNHHFAHRNDRWTDINLKAGTKIVKIKPFSPAYFAVLDAIPDLRALFAVGDRVLVSGQQIAIEVSPDGAETLGNAELRSLKEQW